MVNSRWHALHSWLWPGCCLLCRQRTASGDEICPGCRADLPWITHSCPRCATPLAVESAPAPCGSCQQKPPVFDRASAALRYDAPLDRLITGLKYHRRLTLARTLGQLLAENLQPTHGLPDIIIPVPLHRTRLRERGYNQSLEIAREVSRQLAIPVDTGIAKRIRPTPAQTSLPLKQRAGNVRHAFAVDTDLRDTHVVILDDVMTSGHTTNALAKTLRRAGAREISVWVLARA